MFVGLILKNLLRNKLRTTLTLAAIALPMFVFTIARSFVDVVDRVLVESDKRMRVAVHHKITFTTFLPQRIRGEIEDLAPPGYLQAVCGTSWFGGRVEGLQLEFPNMAVDKDTFPIVYSEYEMTPGEIERFQGERRAAIIGSSLAKQTGWKVGDRVTLKGEIPPYPEMDFVIVAIPAGLEQPWLYFGMDYYDERFREMSDAPVGIHNFWLRCNSIEARAWALREIDPHFANTQQETRTELESTFFAAFAQSGGDWVGLVWTVGRLIVLVAVAVAFNTMSMAFRERTRELAAMRALGFSAGTIVRMLVAEAALIGLFGGMLGVLPLYLLTNLMELRVPGVPISVNISTPTALIALSTALLCGLLAAIGPAVMAGRITVATALRKVV